MNKFIITSINPVDNYFGLDSTICNHPLVFELTLRPVEIDNKSLEKLHDIIKDRRVVTLNDSEYAHFMEPFKDEFIQFMMEKYPDKILSNPESWDMLKGK